MTLFPWRFDLSSLMKTYNKRMIKRIPTADAFTETFEEQCFKNEVTTVKSFEITWEKNNSVDLWEVVAHHHVKFGIGFVTCFVFIYFQAVFVQRERRCFVYQNRSALYTWWKYFFLWLFQCVNFLSSELTDKNFHCSVSKSFLFSQGLSSTMTNLVVKFVVGWGNSIKSIDIFLKLVSSPFEQSLTHGESKHQASSASFLLFSFANIEKATINAR